jgi:hypothetical protein
MNLTERDDWQARAERAEAEITTLRRVLSSIIPERVPGPFICGRGGDERDGLPEQLHVCPSYGCGWSAVYQRLPAADAY